MANEPTFQTLREEYEVVVARHNELLTPELKAYFVSQLYQMADYIRAKHRIPIDDVVDEGDGLWLIHLDDGDVVAGIGIAEQQERIDELDVVMLDDRKAEPGGRA